MLPFFALKQRLATDTEVLRDDVRNVKRALTRTGYYEVPTYGITQFADGDTFSGIRRFQRDHGLRIDGVMEPGGPTERSLNAALSPENAPGNRATGAMRPGRAMKAPIFTLGQRLAPNTEVLRDDVSDVNRPSPGRATTRCPATA